MIEKPFNDILSLIKFIKKRGVIYISLIKENSE